MKSYLSRNTYAAIAAIVIYVAAAASVHGADPRDERLFAVVDGGVQALAVAPIPEELNIVPVEVNFDLLEQMQVNDQFDLTIYDREYRALVTRKQSTAIFTVYSGRIFGNEVGQFAIAVVGDAVAAWIGAPDRKPAHLRWGGPGLHYLFELDFAALPDCAGALNHPEVNPGVQFRDRRAQQDELDPPADIVHPGFPDADDRAAQPIQSCVPPSNAYFDVLMVYTVLARQAAGGHNQIRAEAALAVENMNIGFMNSSISARTRIVRFHEVNYNESGNYETHLDNITFINGIMDDVHTVRANADADFVALLVADASSGGLAWCTSTAARAFSVTRWVQAASSLTLAHEIGHNLGCAHNPENVDCYPNPGARGHWFWVPAESLNRNTIMSYSVNGSSRIPHYSSPFINYNGVPTGVFLSRDNRAQIMDQRLTSEAFRLTRMDVWLDFNYGGIAIGSFNQPHNILSVAVNRVQPGGDELPELPTLHIKASSSSATGVISKPMVIQACGGTVTIGQ